MALLWGILYVRQSNSDLAVSLTGERGVHYREFFITKHIDFSLPLCLAAVPPLLRSEIWNWA